jgi:DNA-binding MarR family transcriptional regulator
LSTQASLPALDAWVRLLHGYTAARKTLSAQLQEEHCLTVNDYEALLRLARAENGMMRRVDLAGSLLLTPSGVTRLLEGLERAGYVAKGTCASDARVTYAVLTEEGRAKFDEASCSHVASIREHFESRFSDEELTTLAELLSRIGGTADGSECTAESS